MLQESPMQPTVMPSWSGSIARTLKKAHPSSFRPRERQRPSGGISPASPALDPGRSLGSGPSGLRSG